MTRKELIELWTNLKEYHNEFATLIDIFEALTGVRNVRYPEPNEDEGYRDNFSTSQKWSNFVELTDEILTIESEDEFIRKAMNPNLDFVPIFRMMVQLQKLDMIILKSNIAYLQSQRWSEIDIKFKPIRRFGFVNADHPELELNAVTPAGRSFIAVAYDHNPKCPLDVFRCMIGKIGEVLINSIFYDEDTSLRIDMPVDLSPVLSCRVKTIEELLFNNKVFDAWVAMLIEPGIKYRDQYLWMLEK